MYDATILFYEKQHETFYTSNSNALFVTALGDWSIDGVENGCRHFANKNGCVQWLFSYKPTNIRENIVAKPITKLNFNQILTIYK